MISISRIFIVISVFTTSTVFAASASSAASAAAADQKAAKAAAVCKFKRFGETDGKHTAWLVVVPDPSNPSVNEDHGITLANNATVKDAIKAVAEILPQEKSFDLYALRQADPANPTCDLDQCYIEFERGPLKNLAAADPATGLYVVTPQRADQYKKRMLRSKK